MADPVTSAEGVKAFDRLGNKVLVPAGEVSELQKMGGRVATPKELAESQHEAELERLRAEYHAKSTGDQLLGHASAALGPAAQNALGATGVVAVHPSLIAYNSGLTSATTMGLDEIGIKEALQATAGKAAADQYGKHILEARAADPGAHVAGSVAGFASEAALNAAGGLAEGGAKAGAGVAGRGAVARALASSTGPASAVGNLVEHGAASVLGGVAKAGVVGRAVATGGELAARGAAEGALYSAASHVTDDVLGDREVAADKIFAAAGYGALGGFVGGGLLGGAGSLAAAGGRKAGGAILGGAARALAKGGEEVAAHEAGAAKVVAEEAVGVGRITDPAAPVRGSTSPVVNEGAGRGSHG